MAIEIMADIQEERGHDLHGDAIKWCKKRPDVISFCEYKKLKVLCLMILAMCGGVVLIDALIYLLWNSLQSLFFMGNLPVVLLGVIAVMRIRKRKPDAIFVAASYAWISVVCQSYYLFLAIPNFDVIPNLVEAYLIVYFILSLFFVILFYRTDETFLVFPPQYRRFSPLSLTAVIVLCLLTIVFIMPYAMAVL